MVPLSQSHHLIYDPLIRSFARRAKRTANTTRQEFKLHLPGLLKVLAEHLYSSKSVAIRELLQNAHDSCLRRAMEGGEVGYRPRIDLSIDYQHRVLTIRDNGCGLTAHEIEEYLATIGRSYTRELKERLAIMSHAQAAELIGQFGFGFLSAFLIADEVVLTTHSYHEGSEGLCWRSSGDEHYDLGPAEHVAIGTTIELRVKAGAAFVLQEDLLVETIQKYADFLPIPIYVGSRPFRVNLMAPPWESENPRADTAQYIGRTFSGIEPLCVIPLQNQRVDLGHDVLTLPLQGFVFVPPSSIASIREYGDLRVYIRRMFILDNERDLLPPWARFVRGVIDCPVLQPTASREGIHQDDTFEAIRQALEEQIGAGLRRLARDEPVVWRQLVRSHSSVLTGWAVKDNAFFEQVADLVTFRTSRGHLTLPDYLQLSDRTLYYVTRELGSLQEQLLAEGHDVPVIDASWFAVTPFLEKYSSLKPGVRLVRLDGESAQILHPASEASFTEILEAYRLRNVRAHVATFKPADVPALMLYPEDADFVLETRDALTSGDLPDAMAGLVNAYLGDITAKSDDLKGVLYLNAACPLVQRLAADPPASVERGAVLTLLYQIARLFSGRTLTAADASAAFRDVVGAIEDLLV